MSFFKGKRILITGSTRGIGRAIADAAITSGAIVGINGRTQEAVEKACGELGASTIPLPGDLSEPENGASLVADFVQSAGGIDALVNNAGMGKAAPFRAMKLPPWQATFRLNLDSAMAASKEAYNAMRRNQQGSIVNITSISAHGPGKWMGADYAASKAALVSMTKSLAFEAGRLGIRVNAVSPGFVETDMTAPLTEEMKSGLGIPMKRLGRPDEIASVVLWLLSEEAAYITGQVVHIDGGLFM